MTTIEELRLAKRAVDRGLLTMSELTTAMTEYARDLLGSGAVSLRALLVDAGCLRNEDWECLLREGDEASPGTFGAYRIEREVGRGAMGVVYQAFDTRRDRVVALKMLNCTIDQIGREESERRFIQEARLLSILPPHPAVVAVYDAGVLDGQRYLAMEFVDGILMSAWLKSEPSIPQQLKVLNAIALGVHHAHEHGILHRDLKPENVLIRRDESPVVMDFGLAIPEQRSARISLTASGLVVGSPGYMSPEQARGLKSLDRTTDVYSLGVMLYQIVAGRMPYEGCSPMETLVKTVRGEMPRPSTLMKKGLNPVLLERLDRICMTALAVEPKRRYPTAKAFAEALGSCARPS